MADKKAIAKYSDAYNNASAAAPYYPTNMAESFGVNTQAHPVASKIINFLGAVGTVLGNSNESGGIFAGVDALQKQKRTENFMRDYNAAVQKDIANQQDEANFWGKFGNDMGIIGQAPKVLTPLDGIKQGDPNYVNVADKGGYGVYNYPRSLDIDSIEKMGNMVSADNAAGYTNQVINSGGKTQELPTGKYSFIKQSDIADITGKQVDAMGEYAKSQGVLNSVQTGYDAGQTVFDKLPDLNVGISGVNDSPDVHTKLAGGVAQDNISDIPFFVAPRYQNEGIKTGYEIAEGRAIDLPKAQSEINKNAADAQEASAHARAYDRTPQLSYAPIERPTPNYALQDINNTAKVYDDAIGQVSGQIASLNKIYYDKNTKNKDRERIKADIDNLTGRLQTLQMNRDKLTQSAVMSLGAGGIQTLPPAPGNTDTGAYSQTSLSPEAQNYLKNRNRK